MLIVRLRRVSVEGRWRDVVGGRWLSSRPWKGIGGGAFAPRTGTALASAQRPLSATIGTAERATKEGEMESEREGHLSVCGFGGRCCVCEEGRKKVGRWAALGRSLSALATQSQGVVSDCRRIQLHQRSVTQINKVGEVGATRSICPPCSRHPSLGNRAVSLPVSLSPQ
jgi:hypothetical protein